MDAMGCDIRAVDHRAMLVDGKTRLKGAEIVWGRRCAVIRVHARCPSAPLLFPAMHSRARL
eukprot:8094106-Pyramimonas_sp.AAC.1